MTSRWQRLPLLALILVLSVVIVLSIIGAPGQSGLQAYPAPPVYTPGPYPGPGPTPVPLPTASGPLGPTDEELYLPMAFDQPSIHFSIIAATLEDVEEVVPEGWATHSYDWNNKYDDTPIKMIRACIALRNKHYPPTGWPPVFDALCARIR